MQIQKLWEYECKDSFECETFHHCPEQYDSWDSFITDKHALTCNCIYGNPLLYWYWDNNDEWQNSEEEEALEFEITKENFKRIVLIYRSWFSSIGKINISVTSEDEPKIRKFIYDHQFSQYVQI